MRLVNWSDLTEEEQRVVKALDGARAYPPEMRKKHRFCTRCWYEVVDEGLVIV